MAEIAAIPAYPRLFSEWQIRSTPIANRVVFAPTCPTWVADPYEGIFTDQAVAYYEERARGGCGLIIIGGTIIHPEALYSEFNFPGLWKDDQVDGLARVAEAVHRHGCKLACQLLHPGLRAMPVLKKDPAYDFDAEWYMVAPSQVPPGEYPNAPMPKELEEHEIQEILVAYADAARRAVAAGLDGVEYHMSHGYLPWQFLSPLYNHRSDGWGGSYENRLRFPVESMTARARGDRKRRVPRLPHQLDLVLAGRSRARGRQARRRRPRERGRSRLRQPVRRRPSLLHPHPDDLRAGLGARLHEGRQGGLDEARPARRAHHAPGRRGGHPGRRRGRRDPARPPDVRRRRLGGEGARGPCRRHPPLRRGQLLLAQRDPGRPRAVRLQRGGRPRAGLGARHAQGDRGTPRRWS